MSKIIKKIQEAVEDGDFEEVAELTQEALDDEIPAKEILNNGLIGGMNIVGELFKDGVMFVPEVLLSAKAVEEGMELLKPHLNEGDIKNSGKIVFCTVLGDLHDIGKKLCVMLLQGAGYQVIDLGVDVGVNQIISAIKEHNPDIVAMSAMLTTTMVTMEEAAISFRENNLDSVKIMVGGAPLSLQFADKIGANYSKDAIGAVALADQLMAS